MDKQNAVASLDQTPLLQPARVRAALKANDRLKLYLSVLQAAAAQAAAPERAPLDLSREIAAADIAPREQAVWLRDLPAGASLQGDELQLPELPRLVARLRDDLAVMARPVLDDVDTDPALGKRVADWQTWLAALDRSSLAAATLTQLTQGRREHGDSLHLTVMDLHKALNRLAARLSGEDIDGAHAWQLAADGSDRPLVAAFMRGLNRTRPLKLDHPGLDTAVTRDGSEAADTERHRHQRRPCPGVAGRRLDHCADLL